MKPILLPLLALCACLLSACYASGALLLDPDAAVQPLAEGTYAAAGPTGDRYRLTIEADGWYDVEPVSATGVIGETSHVLFNVMDPVGGRAAYAVAVEQQEGYRYLVVMVEARRAYMATPDCGDPLDRGLAVDQGAEASDDDAMTRQCIFKDRSALLAALSAFAGQADLGAPFHKI